MQTQTPERGAHRVRMLAPVRFGCHTDMRWIDGGTFLMGEASKCANVEWVAVCDAWDQRREEAVKSTSPSVAKYADYLD